MCFPDKVMIVEYKKALINNDERFFCDSDRIQTCNLLIRSQMLYSVELRSRSPVNFVKLVMIVTPTGFKPVTF